MIDLQQQALIETRDRGMHVARRAIGLSADDSWHLRDTRSVLDHRIEKPSRTSKPDLVYGTVTKGACC
jgi:hypothetical protein